LQLIVEIIESAPAAAFPLHSGSHDGDCSDWVGTP
jgi:hypothetical protein